MNEEYDWFRPQDLPVLFEALRKTTTGGILVGGQALVFWVQFFDIPIPQSNEPFLTQDADIFGTTADAEIVARYLPNATLKTPTPDDNTPNTAVVTYITNDGTKLFIDFLGKLIGIDDKPIIDTAVILESVETGQFCILHPRLVLKSRLFNLSTLPNKRNFNGITQARVAVLMIKSYFDWYASCNGLQNDERWYLQCFEWLFKLSLDKRVVFCFNRWGID